MNSRTPDGALGEALQHLRMTGAPSLLDLPRLLDLEHGLVNDRYMLLKHDGGGPLKGLAHQFGYRKALRAHHGG